MKFQSNAISRYGHLVGLVVQTCLLLQVFPSVVIAQTVSPVEPTVKWDTSGAGAVLCVWSIYVEVQALVKACGFARRPSDDAMDAAILAIDDFIIANSAAPPSRSQLEITKRHGVDNINALVLLHGVEKFCKATEIENFRRAAPDDINNSTKALLATPREPLMNPCL